MISAELALELAKQHEWARREVKPIDPITVEHPDLTIDDAYAVQQAWVELQISEGANLVGRKIGLTSRAMQQQMKIDEPDFGALLDYMIMRSGVELRHADFVIESEGKRDALAADINLHHLDAHDVAFAHLLRSGVLRRGRLRGLPKTI